jgi:septum formation protein
MLILKSASPRRKEILENLGLKFEIQPSKADETDFFAELPLEYLKRVALLKLETANLNPNNFTISADTIVVSENKIIQKPKDFDEAYQILSLLNGKEHSVYSGLAYSFHSKLEFNFEETKVQFKNLSKSEIEDYINISKPFDKAGSYGIQDFNTPVKNFIGSYSNVLGFPIRKFYKLHSIWKEYLF